MKTALRKEMMKPLLVTLPDVDEGDTFDFEFSEKYLLGRRFDLTAVDINSKCGCCGIVRVIITCYIAIGLIMLLVIFDLTMDIGSIFITVLGLFALVYYISHKLWDFSWKEIMMEIICCAPCYRIPTHYTVIIVKHTAEMIKNTVYLIDKRQSKPIATLYNVTSEDIDFNGQNYFNRVSSQIKVCGVILNQQCIDMRSTIHFMKELSNYLDDRSDIIDKKVKRTRPTCKDVSIVWKYGFGIIDAKDLKQYLLSTQSHLQEINDI